MSKSKKNIIWIDMEMTGLNPEQDKILEIACLITNKELKIISEEFNVVINQPLVTLQNMGEWCFKQHSESGLIQESLQSNMTISEAEELLLEFIESKTPQGVCPLAGNTVYMDKLFLMKHLPRVAEHLHYRIIDVSSIHELVRRWYPAYNYKFVPSTLHRALPDILSSIRQLTFYRENLFKPTRMKCQTTQTSDLDYCDRNFEEKEILFSHIEAVAFEKATRKDRLVEMEAQLPP